MIQAMDKRIFDQRLQSQFGNPAVQHVIGNAQLVMKPFAKPPLLDIHVMMQMFKLRSDGCQRIRIAHDITEHFA